MSVRSSVYEFPEEHGRTYHRFKEGNLQHHLFTLLLRGLSRAPIEDLPGGLHNVLDFATGTGIWAIEFANEHPSAVVTGTDLSPIQPDFVPANCLFVVDDAEDPWEFSQQFDYIHGRMLVTCFKSHLEVFKSAFSSLRPGGYIELQDLCFPTRCDDGTWDGTAYKHWMGLIMAGAEALGKDWSRVPKYKAFLQEAGFVDVVEEKYDIPIGTWAKGKINKTLGTWCRADTLGVLQGLSLAVLTKGLGMSVEEVEVLLVDVRKNVNNNNIHLYMTTYVVYGRKP
ncbi:hypothetical protein BP6252_02962 [Coleophoma cylindrospora]|uniref:S-adenosyl-L-methionine-dependent methyltransferase n=1 Tax=Coleophoma cylindrospora TaxID=1849047 RepID=A0A3D8S6L9_9HELO|nr:hypothetical protein BP6252_02962 [Coleophoma cylindrospora]